MKELQNRFDIAISVLRNCNLTLTMQTQNKGKIVTFYKATQEQAAIGTAQGQIFFGTQREAVAFLNGIISVSYIFEVNL